MNKNKQNRRLRKEQRRRKRYDQVKRDEYTKEYLKIKDARTEVPHSYPKTRLVLITDFLRAKDLRRALVLFLGSQLSIFLLLVGVDKPTFAPLIGLLSIIIGLICIIYSIRVINKRQAVDVSRKPVSFKKVFGSLFYILLATTIFSILYNQLGFVQEVQPNQGTITDTLSFFPLPMLFSVLIVAPIVEEVIFRELLPYAAGPSYLSFILTSIMFVVVHSPSGFAGWITYGITTTGFLYARLSNNNVYTGIWAHFLWNVLSLIV